MMDYAIVAVPAAPLRRKPMHRKEMVSQLLFGETVKVLRSKDDLWVKVKGLHDEYEGWLTNTMLEETDELTANTRSSFAVTQLLNEVVIGDKRLHIPVGSSLPFFEKERGCGRLGRLEYEYYGHYVKRDEQQPYAELVKQLTFNWLNAPYMWGGRTPLGVDCSGFVQVIFKLMGIDLPRDAWQQAQEGHVVRKLAQAQTGDLAFFDNKEEIVHVGILLNPEQMIHSSGKVRIDAIDKKSLINVDTGRRGWKLRAIRRMW